MFYVIFEDVFLKVSNGGGGLMWCVLHRVSPIFLTVVWGGGVHVHVVIWHLYGLIHIPFYLVCLLVHYHQC